MQRCVLFSKRRPLTCSSRQVSGSASDWSSDKVRRTFLDFFAQENHAIVPSSSIIPSKWKDTSPLPFVNAGMVKWRPLFTGSVSPPPRFANGVANSQRCIRTNDVDQVGLDGHHLTFFEMLGSWAFNGAYGRDRSPEAA